MTTYNYYVNTNSTPGGNGTTNLTAGATRAYASLSEAEAALQTTINVGDVINITCDGTAADTTRVTIDGWTVSGALNILAAKNHGGVYNTNLYRMESVATGAAQFQIYSREDNTSFQGLQMQYNRNGQTWGAAFFFLAINNSMSGCICASTSSGGGAEALQVASGTISNLKIWNNIIYGWQTGIDFQNCTGDIYIFHNLIRDNSGVGIYWNYGSAITSGITTISNNVLQNNASYDFVAGTRTYLSANSDYNISALNQSGAYLVPGANSKKSTTVTYAGASDFRTNDANAQVNNNLYSDANCPVTTGIAGNARPSSGLVFAGAWQPSAVGTLLATGQLG